MPYALVHVHPVGLDLETFARTTGAHPDLVRRLVVVGVLDAERDRSGGLWFTPAQVTAMARIRRLRAGFSLNYAALGLVMDLLDRIAVLEAALRAHPGPPHAHTDPLHSHAAPTTHSR